MNLNLTNITFFFYQCTGNGHTFNALKEANSKYIIRQCSNCPNDADFICKTCPCNRPCNLCFFCKEKHFYELVTIEHDIVTFCEKNFIDKQAIKNHKIFRFCKRHRPYSQTEWERKRKLICGTIKHIRSEDLFYRRAMLTRIKPDFQECKNNLSIIQLQMLKKAKNMKSRIDDLLFHEVNRKKRILKKKLTEAENRS